MVASDGRVLEAPNWVLEYCTLILFLVLGSYYSYLYLKGIYFFSRVYSKGRQSIQDSETNNMRGGSCPPP